MIMDTKVLPDICARLRVLGASNDEVNGFEFYSEPEQLYITGSCIERQMDEELSALFSCLWIFTDAELDELDKPEYTAQEIDAMIDHCRVDEATMYPDEPMYSDT